MVRFKRTWYVISPPTIEVRRVSRIISRSFLLEETYDAENNLNVPSCNGKSSYEYKNVAKFSVMEFPFYRKFINILVESYRYLLKYFP